MAYKFNLSQGEEVLLKAASIGAAILGIVAVHSFYKNNLWKPKIKVKNVDYPNTYAELEINGRPFILRGDSPYLISYDWGVKFGFTPKADGRRVADRIEILKRNLVKDVLRKSEDVAFSGLNDVNYGCMSCGKSNFTGDEQAIVKDVWGVKNSDSFSIFQDK